MKGGNRKLRSLDQKITRRNNESTYSYFRFVFVLFSFLGFTQSNSREISAQKIHLPGFSSQSQYYTTTLNGRIISHFSTYGHRGLKKKKQSKVRDSSVVNALSFIKSRITDSIYQLSMINFTCNSLDYRYLKENGLIKDSNVILNFNLFQRQASKTLQTCGECLPLIYFQGTQIDGERLLVKIQEDSLDLLNLNIGYTEMSRSNSFQEWILLSEVIRKFNLFPKVDLKSYFSRERISQEISRYVMILKR